MGLPSVLTMALGGAELWQAPDDGLLGPAVRLAQVASPRAGASITAAAEHGLPTTRAGKYYQPDQRGLHPWHAEVRPPTAASRSTAREALRFAAEMARFGLAPGALAPVLWGWPNPIALSPCRPRAAGCGSTRSTSSPTTAALRAPACVLGDERSPAWNPDRRQRPLFGARRRPRHRRGRGATGTSMMRGFLGEDPIDPQDWFPTGDIAICLFW